MPSTAARAVGSSVHAETTLSIVVGAGSISLLNGMWPLVEKLVDDAIVVAVVSDAEYRSGAAYAEFRRQRPQRDGWFRHMLEQIEGEMSWPSYPDLTNELVRVRALSVTSSRA
jgi:hypothetical protein